MTTGEKIKELRKKQGLSQEQLANLVGLSRQAVSRWEAENATPETAIIIRLSDIFHVTTDYLLKDEVYQENNQFSSQNYVNGNIHKKINKRILIGIVGIAFPMSIILVLFFMALAIPALRTGSNGEIVNVWNWEFWTSNELIPLAAIILIVFIVGAYQLCKYYFCDYQPEE